MKGHALFLALAGVALAWAGGSAAADRRPSFRELEYQLPRDPLLPSNQSTDILEHTPDIDMAPALAALRDLIPVGAPRSVAEAVLVRASARCHRDEPRLEHCTYAGVETRDEYVDAVCWTVRLNLADDRVQGLVVDRTWIRS